MHLPPGFSAALAAQVVRGLDVRAVPVPLLQEFLTTYELDQVLYWRLRIYEN